MGSKIASLDFSRYKTAMVEREGYSAEAADECWRDLLVILTAMEAEPTKAFALTAAADRALHGLLLDTAGHYRFSSTVFGQGAIMVHDPFAYGTPEFNAGWQNTRAAFAAHGIELPSDYLASSAGSADPRKAEACLIFAQQVADLVQSADPRKAEACLIFAQQIADLAQSADPRKAEACLIFAKQIAELRPAA